MEKPKVRISVRNLVEFILRSGDLDNSRGSSGDKEAMLKGGRLHRKIQRSMKGNYQAEVSLKRESEYEDVIIQVEGRADGIFTEDGEFWIDEIKGTYGNLQAKEVPKMSNKTVTFVTNERSHELNLEYRDTDRPTDVISLEYKPELDITFDEEDLAENPELAEMMGEFDSYIGELFISIDKAREQAEEYGHSYEREMGFLAVHGFLHINGYDHYTPEEEAEMFGLQEEILTAYGLTRQ